MEKANFVNAEVIKTKATFENITLTRTGGKHRWRNIGTDGRFLDSYCKPKTNRLYILLATALGGRGRKCNHNF
jgi:hypothetical protein